MKLILSDKSNQYFITNQNRYAMGDINRLTAYFFPNIVLELDADLYVYDIQLQDNAELDQTKLNVMICVENCSYHTHYKHYNRYGDYGDDKIQIYFYNHIDRCVFTDTHVAIPIIYAQMRYFSRYYDTICPSSIIPFNKRKFCLIATSSRDYLRYEKIQIIKALQTIGQCDNITDYVDIIGNKSCYHSQELLDIFNQYKFVFVCENSITDGYITEKLFNCLFARTIPIYYGSRAICRYINPEAFIDADTNMIDAIRSEIDNGAMICAPKISDTYDDEQYDVRLKSFIESRTNAR